MKLFNKKQKNLLAVLENSVCETLHIPEPTKSLLFITDDDISNAEDASPISITISFGSDGVSGGGVDNLNSEPSRIWTQLPVTKNSNLEESPLYYPAYTKLNSQQRYQYLMWLRDVSKPTNLSYVFLYYYGLERHLLVGDFDNAFQ